MTNSTLTSMSNISDYLITKKWPAQHPERLQLYTNEVPNGRKISIALEEAGIPYEAHWIKFSDRDQWTPEFLSLNPNNKVPAILDPNGPNGRPIALFESGAILVYLAAKSGKLMPADDTARYETLQWLMFQMSGIGPMFGQLGFFHRYAGKDYEDKRPRDRFIAETQRLLSVLDERLSGREWIMGDEYTIADIAVFPWIDTLLDYYQVRELVGFDHYSQVRRVFEQFMSRPAVQRGMKVPA